MTRTHPGPERARLQTYPCRRFGDTFFVFKFSRLLCTAQKFVLFLFVNPKNPSRRRTATPTTPAAADPVSRSFPPVSQTSRLNGLRRRSMAPKDFRGNDGTLSLAVPWQEATRVVELAASVFDEGEFVAGVEAMVLFRPKLKKTDGDAYVKELVSQIKASKETLKMMLHKKDQLVDACKTLEEEMLSDALVMAQHAVADATAAANAAANASDTDLLGNTKMATTAELQRVSDEKERLHRQNETLQQNLVKIEEAELALQVGIDNLEEERGRIRVEEHSKIKQSLSKREADLEQRISLAEKAEAAAARARDALASSKRGTRCAFAKL